MREAEEYLNRLSPLSQPSVRLSPTSSQIGGQGRRPSMDFVAPRAQEVSEAETPRRSARVQASQARKIAVTKPQLSPISSNSGENGAPLADREMHSTSDDDASLDDRESEDGERPDLVGSDDEYEEPGAGEAPKGFPCPFNCATHQVICLNVARVMTHLNRDHKGDRCPKGYFKCETCDAYYKSKHRFNQHKKTHRDPEEHVEEQGGEDIGIDMENMDIALPIQRAHGSMEELLAFYNKDLYYYHPTWVPLMRTCTVKALSAIANEDGQLQEEAMAAMFILPGLVARYRLISGTTKVAPVDMLRRLEGSQQTVYDILEFAQLVYIRYPAVADKKGKRKEFTKEARKKHLVRKAKHYSDIGRPSVAAAVTDELAKLLEEDGDGEAQRPPLSAEMIQGLIAELFPKGTERDKLQEIPQDAPEPMTLTMEVVLQALRKLKTDRAAGFSGWTNKLLRKIACHGGEDEQEDFARRLTRVFNYLLTGRGSEELRDIWTRARVAFIPKAQGYRPMGVGEVLYRLMGSCIIKEHGEEIAKHLLPHQLGVGVRGGVEIAAIIAGLDYEDGGATLSIDIKNAYNCIPRDIIQAAIERIMGSLGYYFKFVYGEPIALYGSDGTFLGWAGTGVLQGDPLATMLFSIGISAVLAEIDQERRRFVDQIRRQGGEEEKGGVFAIADDITIKGRPEVIFALAPTLKDTLRGARLDINLSKSFIVSSDVHVSGGVPAGWNVSRTFGKTLGRPLGSCDNQRAFVRQAITSKAPNANALALLDFQTAYNILMLCYGHRFDYLRKVLTMGVAEEEFEEYDKHIDKCIKVMLGIREGTATPDLRLMRALPTEFGGLGMADAGGIEHGGHVLLTHTRTRRFLMEHNQSFVEALDDEMRHISFDSSTYRVNEVLQEMEDVSGEDRATLIRKAVRELREQDLQTVKDSLIQRGLFEQAAQLTSQATPGAGRWTHPTVVPYKGAGILFSGEELQESVRSLLLLPFVEDNGQGPVNCTCARHGRSVDLIVKPTHAMCCSRNNKGNFTARHDAIADRLGKLLKEVKMIGVQREPRNHQGRPFIKRPDIYCEVGGRGMYVEVSVVEPTSEAAITHERSSSRHEGAAAEETEKYKLREYAGHGLPIQVFVVESTGRLGQEARALLQKVCGDTHERERKGFLRDLSYIIGASRGRILLNCRRRLSKGKE